MVSALEGKTELFPKKVTKKSPKTGSGWINPTGTISQFFHEFPGSPKILVEMPGAGKRGEAGAHGELKLRWTVEHSVRLQTSDRLGILKMTGTFGVRNRVRP